MTATPDDPSTGATPVTANAVVVPDVVFRRTVTVFESHSAVDRSSFPSPLRSVRLTENGVWPTVTSVGAPRAPVPSPSRTLTRSPPGLPVTPSPFPAVSAVTTSGMPFPFTSPIATDLGTDPVGYDVPPANVPFPFPSRTVTLFEPALAVTRSSFPSRFRSPARIEWGLVPTA